MTVVVKATLAFEPNGEATLIDPSPVIPRDQHFDRSPDASVEQASDLAPYLPSTGVVLHGNAHVIGAPLPSASVRLAVQRDSRTLLDKTLHVFGARHRAQPSVVEPFNVMPLRYERSIGGSVQPENPVGCGTGDTLPNVIVPDAHSLSAGFGPIGWSWPGRKRLIAGHDTRAMFTRIPEWPSGLSWSYFHAAPRDQQLTGYLRGGEWLELDGMHPAHGALRTQIPRMTAHARATLLTPSGASPTESLDMLLDTVVIDAERERFSLVWRGNASLTMTEQQLGQLGFFIGLAKNGVEPAWPAEGDLGDLAAAFQRSEAGGPSAEPPIFFEVGALLGADDDDATAIAHVGGEKLSALPFAAAGATTSHTTSDPGAQALPWDRPQHVVESEEDIGPVPPVRMSDDIPVVTDTHFESATLSWQLRPPQDALIVVIKGTYDIVPGERAVARERSDFCMGEMYVDDDAEQGPKHPSDLALLKPKADVTMFGSACAPKAAKQMKVRFAFGRKREIDKAIHVTGDRVWNRTLVGATPGAPAPFERIPLSYGRAFGGPDYQANPCGRGRKDSAMMPNLDLANAHVTSPSDTHRPACFAPLGDLWPLRWKHMGTYDRSWLKTRWPYYPEDFDWSYYQSAPRDQQLAAIEGNEPFVAEGVHPEHTTIDGKLPAERPRAFIVRREDAGGGLAEVSLRCDTVAFDFDEMKVNLVWRGFIDTKDSDAPEVLALFVAKQALRDERMTEEEATAAYLYAITPEPEAEPEAPPPPAPDPEAEAEAKTRAEEQAAQDAADAAEEKELDRQLSEVLEEAGIDEADLTRPPPPPDREAIADALENAGAAPGEIEEVLAALEPPKPPTPEELEKVPTLRELVEAMLRDGDSFEGFDFEEGDYSDLDFSKRNLSGANLLRCTFRRCSFDEAQLIEAQCSEADFDHATFLAADLTAADLNRSVLTDARFDEAVLVDAEIIGAQGERASFAGARADSAELDDGDWSGATFERLSAPNADFNRCKLDKARFVGATLPNLGFRDSVGAKVVFDDATLTNATFEGARFAGCSFQRIQAPGVVFDMATLDKADLRASDLTGCSMLRTNCRKANLSCATLVESSLVRAQLGGTSFHRANLMNAMLEAADLSIADMRDSNLYGVGFWKATMVETKLDGAIIAGSSLVMRKP